MEPENLEGRIKEEWGRGEGGREWLVSSWDLLCV